jgi:hypothetical protein
MMNRSKEDIHVFCDMDGVLVNFLKHFKDYTKVELDSISRKSQYKILNNLPIEWWATIPWLDDGKELWKHLSINFSSLYILSSPTCDKEEKSIKGKKQWLKEKGITKQIGEDRVIIDIDKHKHVKHIGTSILIDDNEKKISNWRNANGIGILHTNTKDTIEQLKIWTLT